MRRVRPDVVLGMGGYPAVSGRHDGLIVDKPLLIHEQNSIPGLANRILTKLADKVLLGFPVAIRNERKSDVFRQSGPQRNQSIAEAQRKDMRARSGQTEAAGDWWQPRRTSTEYDRATGIEADSRRRCGRLVTHQAEPAPGGAQKKLCRSTVEGELVTFIENMAARYADCDLVICRAGALTIAELSCGGRGEYPGAVSLCGGRSSDIQCKISE